MSDNSQASEKTNVCFEELFDSNLQTGLSAPSWQLPELKQYPGEHFSVISKKWVNKSSKIKMRENKSKLEAARKIISFSCSLSRLWVSGGDLRETWMGEERDERRAGSRRDQTSLVACPLQFSIPTDREPGAGYFSWWQFVSWSETWVHVTLQNVTTNAKCNDEKCNNLGRKM